MKAIFKYAVYILQLLQNLLENKNSFSEKRKTKSPYKSHRNWTQKTHRLASNVTNNTHRTAEKKSWKM